MRSSPHRLPVQRLSQGDFAKHWSLFSRLRSFEEVVTWRQDDETALTEEIRQLTVLECTTPALFRQSGW